MPRPRSIPLGLTALLLCVSAAPATAASTPGDADLACLINIADTKARVTREADKRGADLAIMYYLGRLRARFSTEEIGAQMLRYRGALTPEQSQADGRRCSMSFMAEVFDMGVLNRLLTEGLPKPK